jgi:hypothetical protein
MVLLSLVLATTLATLATSAESSSTCPNSNGDSDVKTGNHYGEKQFIEYEIVYKDYPGTLIINGTGSHYYFPRWNIRFTLTSNYDDEYYGEYPVYFIGQTMHYEVHIKNTGNRVFKNLRVVAMQEYRETKSGYDYTGYFEITQGDSMPGENTQEWVVAEISAGEEIVLEGSYTAPRGTHPGLDQTHLQIWHYKHCDPGDPEGEDDAVGIGASGRLIIDDQMAGVFCPPAVSSIFFQ